MAIFWHIVYFGAFGGLDLGFRLLSRAQKVGCCVLSGFNHLNLSNDKNCFICECVNTNFKLSNWCSSVVF